MTLSPRTIYDTYQLTANLLLSTLDSHKFSHVKRSVVGSGLGLPLVKKIVERHGGHVTLKSDLCVGFTFTIHLPLQKPI
jgi:signal transduction histidine kinase